MIWDRWSKSIRELEAENVELREALHPFAVLGWQYILNIYLRAVPDDAFVEFAGGEDGPLGLRVGDIRKARRAWPGDQKNRPLL